MKCVCGYEYKKENREAFLECCIESNSYPFIELRVCENVRIEADKNGDIADYSEYMILLGCPKCGTIKIDLGK